MQRLSQLQSTPIGTSSPLPTSISTSRPDEKNPVKLAERLMKRLNDARLVYNFDTNKINEISMICQARPEWTTFSALESPDEKQLVQAWLNLLDCIMTVSDEKPRLYFNYTHPTNMPDHHPAFPKNDARPDIMITPLADKKASWTAARFLGEAKKQGAIRITDRNLTQAHGQLARYLHRCRLANAHMVDQYGLVISGKKVELLNMNPAGCSQSEVLDGNNEIKPIVKLVLILSHIYQNSPYDDIPYPHSMIWINSNESNPIAPTMDKIEWEGNLGLIFASTSYFGRLTTVWGNEPEESDSEKKPSKIVIKTSFLEKRLVWIESKILKKLLQLEIPGIPKFLNAGLAGIQEGSDPIEFTIDSRSVQETLYQSTLTTERIEGLTALTKLPDKDFILCLRDALKIIWLAWKKGSILHRDISIGNVHGIPITQLLKNQPGLQLNSASIFNDNLNDPDGVLLGKVIDWGNASDHEKEKNPIPDGQSGTCPFMSRRMHEALTEEDQVAIHIPLDDLESIIYLLLWTLEKPDRKNVNSTHNKTDNKTHKTRCCYYLMDPLRKQSLTNANYQKEKMQDVAFKILQKLSLSWKDTTTPKDKLLDLCYESIVMLPTIECLNDFIRSINLINPEEFKDQVTQFCEEYFAKLVKIFTSYAKNC